VAWRSQPATKQEAAEQALFGDRNEYRDGNQQKGQQVGVLRRLIDVGLETIDNAAAC
jgi:hypothetical protein